MTTLTPTPAPMPASAPATVTDRPGGRISTTPANAIPATRSATDVVRSVPHMLHSEWIKLSSLRSNKAIIGLTLGVGGFVTWAVARYVTDGGDLTVSSVFTFATVFTAVFAAVAGILNFSSESQHGTLAPALTAQPTRSVIAFSKTVMASLFGAFLGATGLVAGLAGASLGGVPMGDTSTMLNTSLWAVLFTAVAAVLGLGIGMIARHSSAAISGLLVWWLVVENLLSVFVAERFSRFLPFVAGNGLLGVDTGPDPSGASELALTTTENALVFGGYAAVAMVIGTVLLYRRDTN